MSSHNGKPASKQQYIVLLMMVVVIVFVMHLIGHKGSHHDFGFVRSW